MNTEWSNNLSYNNTNNIYIIPTSSHFYKTHCWQTDRQTDRQTDIATYRAAIAAKNQDVTLSDYHIMIF